MLDNILIDSAEEEDCMGGGEGGGKGEPNPGVVDFLSFFPPRFFDFGYGNCTVQQIREIVPGRRRLMDAR